jgi:D-lyxose ketol-isomerase
LILTTQDQNKVDKFPSIKLRALAENIEQTHVVIDKKQLDKALARLMVFDKKFDITVMDYSKIVFKDNEMELVSIKNKNFEKIPYISSQNVVNHESIIRFADLVKQLRAIVSKDIDISFGSRPAIVLNSNIKQVIPEIRLKGTV